MVLSDEEIEARMPLWCALSTLFLDTEIQADAYHAIARAAREGNFSAEAVREILAQEVFPAFVFNLMDIAGEWAGFHPDDVRRLILRALGHPSNRRRGLRLWTNGARSRFVAEEWPKIQAALEGREPEIEPAPPPKSEPPILVIGFAVLAILVGWGVFFGGA